VPDRRQGAGRQHHVEVPQVAGRLSCLGQAEPDPGTTDPGGRSDEALAPHGLHLLDQLLGGGVDPGPAEVVDVEALDDGPLATARGAREAGDDPLGHAVGAVGRHRHRHPVALGRAEHPVVHVVDGGVGGGRRGGRAAGVDDGGAALLHRGDEVGLEPGLVGAGGLEARPPLDLRVEHVGVLGGGVVAPDRHVGDVGDRGAGLLRQLGDGPVVVEAGHGREPLARDVRRRVHGDEAVRVRGVAHDEDLHVVGGVVVERLALHREDAAVGLEQVGPLHAGLAGHGADEQGDVRPVERDVGAVGGGDAGEQRERAVVELHDDALERAHRRRDLEELQVDRLVGTEQRAAGDAEEERVADLAGSAGDGDGDGGGGGHGSDPRPRRQVSGKGCLARSGGSCGGRSAGARVARHSITQKMVIRPQ